jgi:hypothetical protein
MGRKRLILTASLLAAGAAAGADVDVVGGVVACGADAAGAEVAGALVGAAGAQAARIRAAITDTITSGWIFFIDYASYILK